MRSLPADPRLPVRPERLQRAIPPGEVARIEVSLLTSVDAGEKIEALRKLALAPVAPAERGALALRALTDPEPRVRSEAANLLHGLGMSQEFCDLLRGLGAEEAVTRRITLEKLISTAQERSPGERAMILAVLRSALENDPPCRDRVLQALSAYAGDLRGAEEAIESVLRSVVRVLAEDPARLAEPALAFVESLRNVAPQTAARTLWREATAIQDRRFRALLYTAVFLFPVPPELTAEMCERLQQEIRAGGTDEYLLRRGMDAFAALGDPALAAVLALADEMAGGEEGPAWVAIADAFACSDSMSEQARARAADVFLTLLEESPRPVRIAILDGRLLFDPRLPDSTRARIARELVRRLYIFRGGRGYDLACAVLRRIGVAAIEPLADALRGSPHEDECDTLAGLIAEIAEQTACDDATRAAMVHLIREQERLGRVSGICATRSVGRIAAAIEGDSETIARLLEDYSAMQRRVSYGADVLGALCWIASSPAAPPKKAVEIALRTLDLLCGPMPDTPIEEEESPEGRRIVIGAGTRAYTEVIPALLRGLARLVVARRLPAGVRARIRERLLARWDDLAEYREVWSPANFIELARTLAIIARAEWDDRAFRDAVLDRFRAALRNVSIVEVATTLLGDPAAEDDDYALRMGRFAQDLLRMSRMDEYSDAADQEHILLALAAIGRARRIGTDPASSEELRRRIVDTILGEDPLEWSPYERALRGLQESPAVGPDLRERIERRIQRRRSRIRGSPDA